jgi:hypothetical protein
MPTTLTYRRISVAAIERDVKAAWKPTSDRITRTIVMAGDPDGTMNLNRSQRLDLINQVGTLTQALFVGADGKSPYDRNGVTPLAPFPRVLNQWYVKVVTAAVRSHAAYLKRTLPEDVYRWLRSAKTSGLQVGSEHTLKEMAIGVDALMHPGFVPNALAQYDPMHFWVNPVDGYTLSTRIWSNSIETRKRMEGMLDRLIAEGRGSAQIARIMEQFLLPGREALRTMRPYGRDVSYYAMRLARSEIASAANRAAYVSAVTNPFVETIDIARSASGDPTCEICAEHATIDIDQSRVSDPIPVDEADIPIYHPHCQCRAQSNVGQSPSEVVRQLRDYMDEDYEAPLTPANDDGFLLMLLGAYLFSQIRQAA